MPRGKPGTFQTCRAKGCDRRATARGLCHPHYKRERRGKLNQDVPLRSRPTREPGKPFPGRYTEPEGYVRCRFPDHPNARADGQIYEHIVVMTEDLGRALAPGETVHHKNGVRNDNRIENLELRVQAHPRGLSVDEAIAWATKVLKRYEEVEVLEDD